MPRPVKKGLDYFPLYVDIFENEKVAAISGEFKMKGEVILIKLLCAVYRNGYYYEWSPVNRMNLLRHLPCVTEPLLQQVVHRLVKWGFFDKTLFYSEKILTSRRIQACYFNLVGRRGISVEKGRYPYLLIPVPDTERNDTASGKTHASAGKAVAYPGENSPKTGRRPVQTELEFAETPPPIKEKETKSPLNPPAASGGGLNRGFCGEEDFKAPPSAGKGEGPGDYMGVIPRRPTFTDGVRRNYDGLLDSLERLRITPSQAAQIVSLADYGRIGHPVWQLLAQVQTSNGKIKQPGAFLLARLKEMSPARRLPWEKDSKKEQGDNLQKQETQ